MRIIYRYLLAKQKIYSKSNLSSGVHLDCWCDKWYPHNFNPSFIYCTGETWWIFILAIYLFICMWSLFSEAVVLLCLLPLEQAVLPIQNLALEILSQVAWGEPQLVPRHEMGSSSWNLLPLKYTVYLMTFLHLETQMRAWYWALVYLQARAESDCHGVEPPRLEAQCEGGWSLSLSHQWSALHSSQLRCLKNIASG